MDLATIEWKEFVKRSLAASLIAEHNYCAAKVHNKRELGEVQTPITIAGTELHEQETSKIVESLGPLESVKLKTLLDAMTLTLGNIKSALKKKRVLANSEKHRLAITVLPEAGIVGVPDIIDCRNGEQPVIIDIKTTDKLPNDPWLNDKLQLAVYVMGLQRLGFKSNHGILQYELRKDKKQTKEFRIDVDDSLRQLISAATKDILRIINGGEPVPTNNRNKCIPCGYRNDCKWSLARD